eukprot:PITA_09736
MFLLHQRLKHLKRRLKKWNKNEFGNIFKAKGEVEKKLQEINQILITKGFTEERKMQADSLQQEWDNRCQQEEIFWRQKSRVQWIKEGERNTRFFHKFTMDHRAHNQITKLIVKHDILEVVEESRKSRSVLRALNESFIALIPKQEKSMTPDRFRPIALCKVVYKIISKVIANRLKPLLPTLVSEEQTGYVEGRQILNNIIQSHEVVHYLETNKQAGMTIQLDIAKAYDKLSWSYIREVLKAYGFDHN